MGRSLAAALIAALALAACAPKAAPGPAWPRLHGTGSDGGQSIAPHEAHPAPSADDSAASDSDGDAPAAQASSDDTTPDQGDAAADSAPAAAAPAPDSSPDTITVDGVTIEIDD